MKIRLTGPHWKWEHWAGLAVWIAFFAYLWMS